MFELTPFVRRNHAAVYDPFRMFDEMEKRFFKEGGIGEFKTDIRDTGEAYELEADLPGVKKEDIKVELDGNYLTVSAERNTESGERTRRATMSAANAPMAPTAAASTFPASRPTRSPLPITTAVLQLRLPKKQEALPNTRRLEIQ